MFLQIVVGALRRLGRVSKHRIRELVLCVLSSGTHFPSPWNVWNLELQEGSEAVLLKPTGTKYLKQRAGDFSRCFSFCSLSKLIEIRFFSNVING